MARSGERPTSALQRGGIEYVELRALDISPFDPVGINERQIRFLEIFLAYCVLTASPPIDDAEQAAIDRNRLETARRGRDPAFRLAGPHGETPLRDRALEVCDDLLAISAVLDPDGSDTYAESIAECRRAAEDPGETPSARFLRELQETGNSLFEFGMHQSRCFAEYFRGLAPELSRHWPELSDESRDSLLRQAEIEAGDTLGFDEYLDRYFA